jgi:hypothetical protein
MNSIFLEFVRVGLRYLLVLLAALGAPEPLVQAVGSEATATWITGVLIATVTEGGWLTAKYNQWREGR